MGQGQGLPFLWNSWPALSEMCCTEEHSRETVLDHEALTSLSIFLDPPVAVEAPGEIVSPFSEVSCVRCQGGSQPPTRPRESYQLVPTGGEPCLTHSSPIQGELLLASSLAGICSQKKPTQGVYLGLRSVSLQQTDFYSSSFFCVYL